ncbi:MAG: glycosyltransferase [candidate division WOR-3 bacterium]
MKKFLIVSYYFPPYGIPVGYLRIYKIAKFLKDKGHNVLIFSNKGEIKIDTKIGDEFNVIWIENEPIKEEIKKKFKILNYLGWPDRRISFFLKGYKKFRDVIKNFNPDYVIISAPPFSVLLYSIFIPKNKLIVDFRDIWSYDSLELIKSPIQRILTEAFESYVIKKSKFCIVLNELAKNYLEKKYKVNKIFVIPHFWDSSIKIEQNIQPNSILTIGYFGTIDRRQGLKKVLKAIGDLNIKLKVLLYGVNTDETLNELLNYSFVEYKGAIPFEKIPQINVDVLLVCLDRIKGYKIVSTNKSKELLALRKPILAIIPSDGIMYKEFLEIEDVYLADIDNEDEIKKVLFELYQDWGNKKLKIPKNIEIYKDEVILEKLYKLIV